jgi:hypothetical protein
MVLIDNLLPVFWRSWLPPSCPRTSSYPETWATNCQTAQRHMSQNYSLHQANSKTSYPHVNGSMFQPRWNVISLSSTSEEVQHMSSFSLFLFSSLLQSHAHNCAHSLFHIRGPLWHFCIITPPCCQLQSWNKDYYHIKLHNLFYYFI